MASWTQLGYLDSSIKSVARGLNIITEDDQPFSDPADVTDQYLEDSRIRVRAFLVLCSSELEEFIENLCLSYLAHWAKGGHSSNHHHCFHALTIYFRDNIASLLEREGYFVDFYATTEQARKIKKSSKGNSGNDAYPVLNRKTLVGWVCNWYCDEVVALSHGISEADLYRLLKPLGFSRGLIEEECPGLVPALQGLAAGRGEAAHRSARSGNFPFEALPKPVYQQMSAGDAWTRWETVRDSLSELRNLLDRGSETEDLQPTASN